VKEAAGIGSVLCRNNLLQLAIELTQNGPI
jgi:hypothetical protein